MVYDPFSIEAMTDPFPAYRGLRAEGPVHFLARYDAWALPRFAEVWEVAHDRERFSIVEGPVFSRDKLLTPNAGPPDHAPRRPLPSFSTIDPPQHTRLRQTLYPAFTPRACTDLAAGVDAMVAAQLAALEGRSRFDVVADYAGPVAVASTLAFLGLPPGDAPHIGPLINRSTTREPGVPGQSPSGAAAHAAIREYLVAAVAAERGAAHEGSVIARLIEFAAGQPLDDVEIALQLSTLLVGGGETLPKIIAGGLIQLQAHPDQRTRLVHRPEQVPQAFEEIVRLEGVLQFVGRTLLVDTTIGDRTMRAGQRVLLLLQSANRDEREFADPDTFSIDRVIPRQVGFGHGVHFCIGAHAARLVGHRLLAAFLARYPDYDVDVDRATRPASEFQIGWTSLPVSVAAS